MPLTNVFGSVLAAAFHAQGLEVPRKSVISFSHHLRNEFLATGRFLTIVAASALRSNAERWALKPLQVDLRISAHSVAVFTLKIRTLSPVVKLFIEHAHEDAKLTVKSH